MKADEIPVSDATNRLQFCLKFTEAMVILTVEPFDSNGLAALEIAFVHST